MATIACLGWGSLVWDPRELPIQRKWFEDGPFIKADFLRRSDDGRITLVLDESAGVVRSLWALMAVADLLAAKEALARREGTWKKTDPSRAIGSWDRGDPASTLVLDLAEWTAAHGVDHVIWTALPKKFHQDGTTPTADDIVEYLIQCHGPAREHAERYVRLAPRQIDTPIRRRIEAELSWTALS